MPTESQVFAPLAQGRLAAQAACVSVPTQVAGTFLNLLSWSLLSVLLVSLSIKALFTGFQKASSVSVIRKGNVFLEHSSGARVALNWGQRILTFS